MTIGEKIKRYRIMRGLTQQQLGVMCGYKESTADVRISQYEKDAKIPKMNARKQFAEALNIDISAFSDFDVRNDRDIMRVLLEIDEVCGISIESVDNKKYISFNNRECLGRKINDFLDAWLQWKMKKAKNGYLQGNDNEYEIWKARVPLNIEFTEGIDETVILEMQTIQKEKEALSAHYVQKAKKEFAMRGETEVFCPCCGERPFLTMTPKGERTIISCSCGYIYDMEINL